MLTENLYINTSESMRELTPWYMRDDEIMTEFIGIISDELGVTNDNTYSHIRDIWNVVLYGNHTGSIEDYLNDNYDTLNRGIYITTNAIARCEITLYENGEYDPTPDTLYETGEGFGWELYETSEIAGLTYISITINIPSAVWSALSTAKQDQFKRRFERIKPAGKTYEITTY